MEFQGLTDKQTQDLFTLSEICGVELSVARQLLERADFNLQQATQLHFNPAQQVAPQPYQEPYPQPYQQQYQPQMQFQGAGYGGEGYDDFDFDENEDPGYTKYRNYRFSGRSFQTNYPSQSNGIKGIFSWVSNKFRGQVSPGERFKTRLDEIFPRANKINFQKGNFLQAMYLVKKEKFPLIVLIHDFKEEGKLLLKSMVSNNSVAEFFNTTFRVIGFDQEGYEADELLKSKVDRKNIPCLAVFKVDECEEITMMDVIELVPETDFKELKKRLNLSKSKYIKDEIKESEYLKRLKNELSGNFSSNPMTFERKLELQEERRLKQIQEKELKEHNRQLEEKKREQELLQQKQKVLEEEGKHKVEQRKVTRENFPTYQEGIRFRLRLPNGTQLVLVAPDTLKVQHLFDFVECQDDIGLEQDVHRKFDIIRPYDKLMLGEVKGKSLREVFGETDSESLVVNEL